jgi:glutamyl-tRNA reductase
MRSARNRHAIALAANGRGLLSFSCRGLRTINEDVMARGGFIGVGNMGSLMARNLIRAGTV